MPTHRALLKARLIVPSDSPPVRDGVLTICAGKVERIGPAGSRRVTRDLGNVAIIPQLVNAHTHLEFSDLSVPVAPGARTFADWLTAVLEARTERSSDVDSIHLGLRESKQSGVGYVHEIATAVEIPAAIRRSPIGGTRFLELIASTPQRAEECLSVAADYLAFSKQLPANWQAGLSPHAPYTTSLELVRRVVDLARRYRAPVAMHLAETKEELELLRHHSGPLRDFLQAREVWNANAFPQGTRPLDYLQLLATAPYAWVVHGNYLDDEELAFIADHDNLSLVYCPRTHAFFGHAEYPLRKALDLGVRVKLGTDSRASNPDLSLWDELRYVAQHCDSLSDVERWQLATAGPNDRWAEGTRLAVGAPVAYSLVQLDAERDDLLAGNCSGN